MGGYKGRGLPFDFWGVVGAMGIKIGKKALVRAVRRKREDVLEVALRGGREKKNKFNLACTFVDITWAKSSSGEETIPKGDEEHGNRSERIGAEDSAESAPLEVVPEPEIQPYRKPLPRESTQTTPPIMGIYHRMTSWKAPVILLFLELATFLSYATTFLMGVELPPEVYRLTWTCVSGQKTFEKRLWRQ